MDKPIRVLIADDHAMVRQGLEIVINSQRDMTVVGQASDGVEAVAKTLALLPDVVVLDIRMPRKNGLEALAEIQRARLETRVLMITSYTEEELVLAAVRQGAAGFMLKDATYEEVLSAIRAVFRGDSPLHPTSARALVQRYQQELTQAQSAPELTPAERRVLQSLAQGRSNGEIAAELGVSVRTINTHVRHILSKLGAANRTQAALYARERGLV